MVNVNSGKALFKEHLFDLQYEGWLYGYSTVYVIIFDYVIWLYLGISKQSPIFAKITWESTDAC